MKDLNKAKEILISGEYTCVLCLDDAVLTSARRGVAPLVSWMERGACFENFCAADKVVGKATAFLYALLYVKAVYAHVISRSAVQVLKDYDISVEYDELVENIINRKGDGICPFEAAVLDVNEPVAAYEIILAKMKELNIVI